MLAGLGASSAPRPGDDRRQVDADQPPGAARVDLGEPRVEGRADEGVGARRELGLDGGQRRRGGRGEQQVAGQPDEQLVLAGGLGRADR